MPYMGENEASVFDIDVKPVDADPEPTIPAKIGMTTFMDRILLLSNMIAKASNAKRGTIINTRFTGERPQSASQFLDRSTCHFVFLTPFLVGRRCRDIGM